MQAPNTLGELLGTLFDRRSFNRRIQDGRQIRDQCLALLDERAEASGQQLATSVLNRYSVLDGAQRAAFFGFLNDELDLDAGALATRAKAYQSDPTGANYAALAAAAEPRRQRLFRKLNAAPGATAEIVKMRKDLLAQMRDTPELARTDHDLVHLLRSWFNRGFLVLRQITWDSPASTLEKIIAYEAVHQIQTWDDLRRRLHPADRRCFAFFHPAMPDEPLIFVEVALTKGIPTSIQSVLSDTREAINEAEANTAVFYSISNCQGGLAKISFGNSLIKQVARDLARELSGLKSFVTLSPIPGLRRWTVSAGLDLDNPDAVARLAAHYLVGAKSPEGLPLDPVARFHLGNGARVHAIHAGADLSDSGMAQSAGAMVNYLYDLAKVSKVASGFATTRKVPASAAVRALAKQAAAQLSD